MLDFFDEHPIMFVFVTVVGLVIAIFLVAWPLEKYDCLKLGDNTGKETKYHVWGGGCLIKVNGEFIPSEQWINNSGK